MFPSERSDLGGEEAHRAHTLRTLPTGTPARPAPSKVGSKLQTQDVNRDLGFQYTA